jgi:hypothetical protein
MRNGACRSEIWFAATPCVMENWLNSGAMMGRS